MRRVHFLWVLVLLWAVSACGGGEGGGSSVGASGGGGGGGGAAQFSATEGGTVAIANGAAAANGRDFGARDIAAGATSPLSIVIANAGSATLTLGTPALGGADAGQFVLNTAGLSASLAPSAQTTFTIAFDPSSAGQKNASVSMTHDGGNTATPFVFDITGLGTTGALPSVQPDITISGPASIMEGNVGTAPVAFTISLSQATALTVGVNWQAQGGASNPATSGTDFQAASGTATFTSGQTSKTVTVQVIGDTTVEPNESLAVTLSNATNGVITTSSATRTITNDDSSGSTGGRVIMAYAENIWGAGGAPAIQNFDYSAVTHVIHGFVLPEANGSLTEHSNFNDFRTGGGWMPQTLPGAVHAAGRKIIFSVGGAAPATNPTIFAGIAASSALRATFIANVVNRLNTWGYDGVDIDYEWPSNATEGQQFTTLMSELYTAVKANNPNHVVMFGAGPGNFEGFKQWSQLANHCDYCFFFGYDWHYGLAAPAPVGPIKRPGQTWTSASGAGFEASVRGSVNYALGQGFPAAKMVVGLPFYNDVNNGWSSGTSRTAWQALTPAQRSAALHADYMEALISGHYVTTPESINAKMSALLDLPNTVLRDASNTPVVAAGIGWWEWGHENPSHGELTAAVKAWLLAHP